MKFWSRDSFLKSILYCSVILIIISFDQFLKEYAIAQMCSPFQERALAPFLGFRCCYNPRLIFGFFAPHPELLPLYFLLSGGVLTLIVNDLVNAEGARRFIVAFPRILTLSGVISNLFDHLVRGAVIDYLVLYLFRGPHVIINLADLYIGIGVLWCLFLG